MPDDWKTRLVKETRETADRLNKLNQFMATKDFYNLDRMDKTYLYKQQRTMSELVEILGQRCELYRLTLY